MRLNKHLVMLMTGTMLGVSAFAFTGAYSTAVKAEEVAVEEAAAEETVLEDAVAEEVTAEEAVAEDTVAEETVEEATEAATQTPAAIAQGWVVDGSTITVYDENGQRLDGWYQLLSTFKNEAGYTIQKGFYHMTDGKVDSSIKAAQKVSYKTLTKDGQVSAAKKSIVLGKPAAKATTLATAVTATGEPYTGKYTDGKVYMNGELFTGIVKNTDGVIYQVTKGVIATTAYTGVYSGNYINLTSNAASTLSDKYLKNGKLATACVNLKYYKLGVFQVNYTGWKKIGTKRYYFTKGVAPSKQFKLLKDYLKGKTTYKYYFKADGSVSTNLFKDYGYNKCIKTKMKIKLNVYYHNITFYMYDSTTKKYDIPLKTVVASTPKVKKDTPWGHHRLQKTTRHRWMKVPYADRYYQFAVFLYGTDAWIHSSAYSKMSNPRSLITKRYNGLGTSQTAHCIRMQACNAKIVWDVATKTNKKERVWFDVYSKKSEAQPFGKVKLKDTTGKVSSKTKADPTDPILYPKNKWMNY